MWPFIIFIIFNISTINALGYYRVVGPRVVRPNSEYHAAISTQGTSVPTSVTVTLVGRQNDGKVYHVEESLVVEPYNTRIVKLQIDDIKPGDYRLLARGNGGISFEASAVLNYTMKSYSVFIQTDKPVYRPGQKILFRALILNPEFKPHTELRNEPINVHISDGKGNIVKEWRRIIANRGVFTEELRLSDSPVLGDWNISVNIHGQMFNKTIKVLEYVLPKFFVDIEMKKHITFSENVIIANIKSQYIYGQNVKGDATITMYPTIRSGVIQPIFQNPIRKVVPIDGSVSVDFDITKDLKLSDEYERTVIVDVIIEETLTGRRQNNSVEIFLHKYEYKMELIKTADYYKPGLKYTAYLKVINHDNSPIPSDKRRVVIRHGYSKADEIYQENIYNLDRNGVATLVFYPPRDATNQSALRIEAEYLDLKDWFSPVPAAVSSSNNYIQASIITQRPVLNQDVEVQVNCTEPLSYIGYELLARGDVIIANTLQVRNEKTYQFRFPTTKNMVPVVHLIVNYVRPDGELVADSLDIEVYGLFQNYIDVKLNTLETEPASEIDLTIKAQPNSYVGLLAVDENIKMFKSEYDITQNEVATEYTSYDFSEPSPYLAILEDQSNQFSWKPGSSNARDIFYKSGAIILTNSIVNSIRPTLEDIYLRPPEYKSSTVKPDRGPGLSFQTVTRPPLAGPYAFSRIPRPTWDKPRVYLNRDIQDTWLFMNFSSGYEGRHSVKKRVPNSLTNWMITGFSLDPLYGLDLMPKPKSLKVFKTFTVHLDLPNSIQRGEILAVPVVVYNYQKSDYTAEITLHNTQLKFDFEPPLSNETNGTLKIESYRKKTITVKNNSGASASFLIRPNTLGYIEIKATATVKSRIETVQKTLFVKAEGERQYYSKSILLDLRQNRNLKTNITLDIPKNIVPQSELIEVSVVGDLLGSTIMNLDHLTVLPTGCGEQNLINFIPNIIVLNYLKNTRQLTQSVEQKAISYLETGYQKQLTYKRMDGSFSAFGSKDTNGSIWLTALVAQAFKQAENYIYVDKNIISNALIWLANNQAQNGSFPETGSIIHRKIQNPDENSLALTAFAALAFIENKELSTMYSLVSKRALDYVAANIQNEEDTYAIAIATYALHLGNHPFRRTALNILELKAKTNKTMKWWAEDVPKNEEKNPWHYLPKSIDIEMTSYALLTYVEANLIDDAIPVLNWLISQENMFGGFATTHDTLVGLHALAKITEKLSTLTNMQVKFSYKQQESNNISVNKENAMIVRKYQIGSDARVVNVSAQGSGLVLFRVSYQYNINVTAPWPMFTLDPQVDKNSNIHHLQISICTGFVSRNLSETPESNLAVMEVTLPSGFTADIDALPSLQDTENVKLVETKNSHTTVILYYDKITREEYCPTVSAFRTHKVAKLRPVPVVVYDYYDTSRKARVFYQSHSATLCNICDEDDCENVCVSSTETQISENDPRGTGVINEATGTILILSIIYFFLTRY